MNQEQIPAGFEPDVWAKLTPEQKQAYLQGSQGGGQQYGQPQQYAQPNMMSQGQQYGQGQYNPYGQGQNMQSEMMKQAQKQAYIGMAIGLVSSLFSTILGFFWNRRT